MGHGKKRISYWIDRRLTGLAGPEYHAIISFGLPIEPEDSQYGKYRLRWPSISSRQSRSMWLGCPTVGSPAKRLVAVSTESFGHLLLLS